MYSCEGFLHPSVLLRDRTPLFDDISWASWSHIFSSRLVIFVSCMCSHIYRDMHIYWCVMNIRLGCLKNLADKSWIGWYTPTNFMSQQFLYIMWLLYISHNANCWGNLKHAMHTDTHSLTCHVTMEHVKLNTGHFMTWNKQCTSNRSLCHQVNKTCRSICPCGCSNFAIRRSLGLWTLANVGNCGA